MTQHPAGLRFFLKKIVPMLIKKLISNYEKLKANGG